MFRVVFVAVLALCLNAVLSDITDLSEFDELEREFDRLAHGTQHHHRHHRHRHLRHRHPSPRHHKRMFLLASGPSTVIPAPPPTENLLPGRHPAVKRKLRNMKHAMRDLAGRKKAAAMTRERLEKNVNKAILHMNEATGIKRELARTEARIRAEEVKLRKLEDDRLRIDTTHGHLVSSLHHIMEPKIEYAETLLKQKERNLRESEAKATKWEAEEKKFHESSLAMIEQRKATKVKLEVADQEIKKAQHDHDVAKKELQAAKHNVAFNVEGYQIAKAHAAASKSEEARNEEHVRNAKHSLKRLSSIMTMEQRRVDESMAIGKDRVQGRIRELEGVRKKSQVKFSKLSDMYAAWQGHQRTWARQVAVGKQMTQDASKDYAEHQQAILDAAQAKVAYDAESDSDWAWDEWPAKGKPDTDDVDLPAI